MTIKVKAETVKPHFSPNAHFYYGKAININTDNYFSLTNGGPQHVFHNSYNIQLSADVGFAEPRSTTSVCLWEISLYHTTVWKLCFKHCLARFIAACWTFTINIPDCCKKFACSTWWLPTVKFSSWLSTVSRSAFITFSLSWNMAVQKQKKRSLWLTLGGNYIYYILFIV